LSGSARVSEGRAQPEIPVAGRDKERVCGVFLLASVDAELSAGYERAMAFLQRVTNGTGRIEREYVASRGRMDLAVEYHGTRNIIEIKLLRQGKTLETVC
jgi:hypothetical protein